MEPLVTAQWLYKNLTDPDLIILDSSPESNVSGLIPKYPGVQIKGAHHFNLKKSFSDPDSDLPNMMPLPDAFSEGCQKLGINNNSKIVVYDNLGVYTSARVWWMFKVMGHKDVSVLNGGLSAWVENDFPSEPVNGSLDPIKKGNFKAVYNPELIKNAEFILKNIDTKECKVIDARSEDRFYGKTPEPREDLRSGHIPGSLNLPFKKVLKDGYYLPKPDLVKIFKELNLNNDPMIFTCGSGLSACIILLGMELASNNKKFLYDGSWSEWGLNADYPVE